MIQQKILLTIFLLSVTNNSTASLVELQNDVDNLHAMTENLLEKMKDTEFYDGIDETKIDEKSGYPEEIIAKKPVEDMTEVDINDLLGYKDDEAIKIDENGKRGVSAKVKLWPKINGRLHIPYVISSKYSESYKQKIREAISRMNSAIQCNPNTWKPKTDSDSHYVMFMTGLGCASFIGRVIPNMRRFRDANGKSFQGIMLHESCIDKRKGVMLHEMLHTMGFNHEQSRMDRDKYVKIAFENIRRGRSNNFKKENSIHPASEKTAYDYGSVMHYPRDGFSKNGRDTIVPLKPGVTIGQRVDMSDLDVEELNNVYGCSSTTTMRPTATNATRPTTQPATKMTTRTTTTTKRPVTTTKSSTNSEVFNCGFGTTSCDLNNPRARFILHNFKKVTVNCKNLFGKCDYLKSLGLCHDRYFGHLTRRRCQRSCAICKPSGGYISTRGSGVAYIQIKPEDCTDKDKQTRTRKRYCLTIKYERTSRYAPKFRYYSYSGYRTSPRYVRNFGSSFFPMWYIGTERESVYIACSDYFSYIYLYLYQGRTKRGELRFKNITLKEGSC